MTEVFDFLINRKRMSYLRTLTLKQQKTLREFDEYNERKNLKRATRENQITVLGHLGDDVKKEYQNMTKDDVNNWLNNKDIKPYSRHVYQLYLQKLFKWLGKDVEGWFEKIENAYDKVIAPSELWSPEEISELIIRYPEVQYRALTMTLYDSEARVSELCSMNVQDVEFVAGIATIFIRKSKTQVRRIELIFATKELIPWYNLRKEQAKPTDPLWISKCNRRKGRRLSQGGVYEILKYGRKLLGTNKHINPHLLRHSMASYLRKNGYPDALHNKRMGLAPGSKVLERYTHVSDMEVSNGARLAFGAEPIQKKAEYNPLLPKKCPRCGTDNRSTDTLCSKCFYSIDYENAEKELTILEMFKCNFAKATNLDTIFHQYRHYKQEMNLLEHFNNILHGNTTVETEKIRQYFRNNFKLTDGQIIEFLQILAGERVIDIVGDKVFILGMETLEEYIQTSKEFLEINKK
ncbi:MAG: tyrosine-type recombinase/integrase [Candidatus Heimdallarchaeaceae archaeon]